MWMSTKLAVKVLGTDSEYLKSNLVYINFPYKSPYTKNIALESTIS